MLKYPKLLFRDAPPQVATRPLGAGSVVRSPGAIPVALSWVVLVAGWFSVAPVRDAATLTMVPDMQLGRPDAYVDFAPLSDLLDAITLLSERQHIAVLLGVVAMWSLWRLLRVRGVRSGWRDGMRSFAILLSFIAVAYAAAAYLPRPMAYLVSADPDVLRIDFHSHTQSSKDARASYSVERNRAWHAAAGYDVAYVTDHHTFVGTERALASDRPHANGGVILLPGIEASWKGEHVGLLGDERESRRVLSSDLHDIHWRGGATAGCCSTRAPIVVWNHPRDPHLKSLPPGAVRAIEIANGALHGMDLVRLKRQQIVTLAQTQNLALLSGTDSHGWGYTAPNWTLLRLKGWRNLDRDELAARIEEAIHTRGFGATRVVERATADPGSSAAALALSVFLVPWRMATELSAEERRAWLLWVWGIAGVASQLRRRQVLRPALAASPAG